MRNANFSIQTSPPADVLLSKGLWKICLSVPLCLISIQHILIPIIPVSNYIREPETFRLDSGDSKRRKMGCLQIWHWSRTDGPNSKKRGWTNWSIHEWKQMKCKEPNNMMSHHVRFISRFRLSITCCLFVIFDFSKKHTKKIITHNHVVPKTL